MKRIAILFVILPFFFGMTMAHANVIEFEDLVLDPESHWNGSDESGGFTSKDAFFNNTFNTTYGSWDGLAYSNRTDISETDWQISQFISITGDL